MEIGKIYRKRISEIGKAPWLQKAGLSLGLLFLSLYLVLVWLAVKFLQILSTSCFFCH